MHFVLFSKTLLRIRFVYLWTGMNKKKKNPSLHFTIFKSIFFLSIFRSALRFSGASRKGFWI